MNLSGKVIVVTGGTGVLGYSFNKAIVAAGGSVCILGRKGDTAEARAAELTAEGGRAIGIACDVLNESDLRRANERILSEFGKIDGLVNAAGGNQPGAVVQPEGDLFALDMGALEAVLQLNLFGSLLPTQVFGQSMRDTSEAASIVNISSVSARTAVTKVLGYSMAKAAIESYTKWMAVELGRRFGGRIRINAIMPGFFLTEQNRSLLTQPDGSLTDRGQKVVGKTPLNRFGRPEELSAALVYLLSDASSFVMGSSLEVDGGFTMFSGV
ncbi:SDR family oxidoreductase [Flaviaesturariibacter amylovorans]|uniref:SDR family oxidoreductase n=1 Tax=Flaviaesturariibacter amylovorans TaxID=1084520 RepID=A0ABP8GZK1_9BACT